MKQENGRRAASTQHDGPDTPQDDDDHGTLTTVYNYTLLLPLVPAMLTDAWPEEVIQSLRLHRALKLLLAALGDCEVRP